MVPDLEKGDQLGESDESITKMSNDDEGKSEDLSEKAILTDDVLLKEEELTKEDSEGSPEKSKTNFEESFSPDDESRNNVKEKKDVPLKDSSDKKKDSVKPNFSFEPAINNPHYRYPENRRTVGAALRINEPNIWFWLLIILIPTITLAIIYGVIPLGDAESAHVKDQWVLNFFIMPGTMTLICYLNLSTCLASLGVPRPFHVHTSIPVMVYLIQVVFMNVTVNFVGTFEFLGLVTLSITYFVTYVSLYAYERAKVYKSANNREQAEEWICKLNAGFVQYIKVVITLFVFLMLLVAYIFAFAYSSEGQKVLPFVLTIVTFIIRKVCLSLMDIFPLEFSMVVSGFWVQNMCDMIQVMAYPSVQDPSAYVVIWFSRFGSNISNLLFLTDSWFKFRVWIKAFFKSCFHGDVTAHPAGNEIDTRDIDDERGHSNNKPGYHRRQVRFYLWKILSQMFAGLFYLANATILRYGLNKRWYPFSTITQKEFLNSIWFALANFAFVIVSGIVGWIYVKYWHSDTFKKLKEIHGELLMKPLYVGYVTVIVVYNGILALSILLYHDQIWYAFDVHSLDDDDD